MKKVLCCLLMVWFAVVSGSVSAHEISDVEHSGHNHSALTGFDKPTKVSAAEDVTPAAVESQDTCAHSHCNHGHNVGVAPLQRTFACAEVTGAVLPARSGWQSAEARNDIERPKWLVTTPAVVSLLA